MEKETCKDFPETATSHVDFAVSVAMSAEVATTRSRTSCAGSVPNFPGNQPSAKLDDGSTAEVYTATSDNAEFFRRCNAID
jgi:hypothetical protein